MLTLAYYANAIPNDFLFDDVIIIKGDERITEGQFGRILTEPYWPGEAFSDRLYRPIVSLSYAVNWAIAPHGWGFRIPNLLMHLAVCWLVFELTRRIFASTTGALLAALLFAIHPIHTEPLNTIVGRADVLGTAFGLGAVLLWWRDGSEGPRRGRAIVAASLFAAALLCKESGITYIGVAVVLDWLYRPQGGDSRASCWIARLRRCYLPAAVVVVAYLGVRLAVLDQITNEHVIYRPDNPIATPAEMLEPGDSRSLIRWGTPLYTFGKAAGMMFWPTPLIHDYSYPAIREVARSGDWRLWYGVAWAVGLGIVGVVSWRRRRVVLIGLAFALIPYSIVSNFVVLIGTIFGERLLYTPSVGFCMAMGMLLAGAVGSSRWMAALTRLLGGQDDAAAPPRPGLAAGVTIVLVVAAGAAWWVTVQRNRDWRSPEALTFSVPDDEFTSFKVLDAYADELIYRGHEHLDAGRPEEARRCFERSLEYGVRARDAAPDAWGPYRAIGRARYRLGMPNEALGAFVKALGLGAGWDIDVNRETIELLLPRGEYCNICLIYDRLVMRQPTWENFNNFADARMRCPGALAHPDGRVVPDAVSLAERALALNPHSCAVYHTLAEVYASVGRLADGRRAIADGLTRCPADDPARGALELLGARFNE